MTTTQSSLTREQIVDELTELLGASVVDTDQQELRAASVDRFRKYTAVHGIFDGPLPAAIVYAESADQVAAVLAFAHANRVPVVPRTGGTSTEGGLETVAANSIVLDGSRMDQILAIDAYDMQVTVQCGARLEMVEEALRREGLTTGHSPQSKPLAQYGGLVSTRSIGQLSTLYGGIEDMVMGLEAVLPDGRMTRIKSVPRRAAGPDIRHIVIGNEGALCYITEVTLKVFRYQPENTRFHGYLVEEMDTGVELLREVIVAGYRPSVARLYSQEDAAQHFGDFTQDKCLVVFVSEGPRGIVEATSAAIEEIAATRPAKAVEPDVIRSWFEALNWDESKILAEKEDMLANARLGYTTEVSVDWSRVGELYRAVMGRLREEYPLAADLSLLGAHSSHSYQTGTNLYFVYDYNIDCEPREEIEKYHLPINAVIVEEALRHGGSMVHHHGVGKYRTPWMHEEHGSGYELLAALKQTLDPHGVMNPGTLFPVAQPGVGDASVSERSE